MSAAPQTLVTMVVRPGSRGMELASRAADDLRASVTLRDGVADFVLADRLSISQARSRISRALDGFAADWPRHLYFPRL